MTPVGVIELQIGGGGLATTFTVRRLNTRVSRRPHYCSHSVAIITIHRINESDIFFFKGSTNRTFAADDES